MTSCPPSFEDDKLPEEGEIVPPEWYKKRLLPTNSSNFTPGVSPGLMNASPSLLNTPASRGKKRKAKIESSTPFENTQKTPFHRPPKKAATSVQSVSTPSGNISNLKARASTGTLRTSQICVSFPLPVDSSTLKPTPPPTDPSPKPTKILPILQIPRLSSNWKEGSLSRAFRARFWGFEAAWIEFRQEEGQFTRYGYVHFNTHENANLTIQGCGNEELGLRNHEITLQVSKIEEPTDELSEKTKKLVVDHFAGHPLSKFELDIGTRPGNFIFELLNKEGGPESTNAEKLSSVFGETLNRLEWNFEQVLNLKEKFPEPSTLVEGITRDHRRDEMRKDLFASLVNIWDLLDRMQRINTCVLQYPSLHKLKEAFGNLRRTRNAIIHEVGVPPESKVVFVLIHNFLFGKQGVMHLYNKFLSKRNEWINYGVVQDRNIWKESTETRNITGIGHGEDIVGDWYVAESGEHEKGPSCENIAGAEDTLEEIGCQKMLTK